jgi:hypothetical protein
MKQAIFVWNKDIAELCHLREGYQENVSRQSRKIPLTENISIFQATTN